jgi:hypothetical protein
VRLVAAHPRRDILGDLLVEVKLKLVVQPLSDSFRGGTNFATAARIAEPTP